MESKLGDTGAVDLVDSISATLDFVKRIRSGRKGDVDIDRGRGAARVDILLEQGPRL